ncbi:PfkB family carbohydrate kinase [Agromyces sp. NPDC060279]|uniref:PfkB family carbohydrate kinase n=1 Tax=Agromyces sp. NPDC060279 TaxID=3347092 RepID=UPI00366A2E32
MTGRVIHTGQAVVDLVMNVPAMPHAGEDVFATSHEFTPGGGFNVMAAASRDGAAVVYPGGHGTGRFGELVRHAMAAEGVAVTQPVTGGMDTGFSVAIVDASAERTFVSTLGAEQFLSRADLDGTDPRDGDVVSVSGYSLYHAGNAEVILDWVGSLPDGVAVVVDPSPMIDDIPIARLHRAIDHATVWTTNEAEARLLAARLGLRETSELAVLCRSIAVATGVTVILRANRRGAYVSAATGEIVQVAPFPVDAVDTNGAGDAHTGVLCAGLAQGRELVDSVRRANAAAAIAVTRRGPATSPTRAEIDALVGRRS